MKRRDLCAGLLFLGVLVILLCNCGGPPLPDPGLTAPHVAALPDGSPNLGVLDWIAWAAALIAAGSLIASGFFPVSGLVRVAGVAVAVAVGAWVLKTLLHDLLWLATPISIFVGLLAGAIWTWGHRVMMERVFGVDFNRNGEVGA